MYKLQNFTAQRVAALQFELSAAARDARDPQLDDRLHRARDAAAEILEEIRTLSRNVHSAVLDDLGLPAALKRLARDAGNGNAIDFDVDVGDARLPPNVEAALLRVAQEATYNATYSEVVLQIHDDGKRFRAENAAANSGGRGLASMRERLAPVDGTPAIDSAPNDGTTITATVPL